MNKYTSDLRAACRNALRGVPAACMVIGSATVPAGAIAADWSYTPRIALSAEYDDNDRMSTVSGNETEVYGPKLDARLLIRGSTPRTTFTLTPQVVLTAYNESDNNLEDFYVRMGLDHKTQRTESQLNARYSSFVTLGRFFPSGTGSDPVLGNPDPGENVPRVATSNREDRFTVSPEVAFELTQRQRLELGVEYLDVSYDEQSPGDVDFENNSVFANYRFETSSLATLSLLTRFEKYEPVDDDSTDYYSINGEWAKNWSETSRVYVRAGASFVDASPAPGSPDSGSSTGFSGGAGAEWTYQVTRLLVDLNQYLDPNSDGQLVNRTQLRLGVSRDLSPKTVLTFGVRGINDAAPPGDDTFRSQKYFAGDIGMRYRLTRTWTLFGGYTYRWKEIEDAPNSATANALSLGASWAPLRQ